MTTNFKIVKIEDAQPPKRKSPAQVIIDSLSPDYLVMKSVAERYGVNVETIRRLCKAKDANGNPRVKAPSEAVQQGKLVIYLFNKEDVAELDEYMVNKGYNVVANED